MESLPNLQKNNETSKNVLEEQKSLENVESINNENESHRVNILTRFLEKNKTKLTLLIDSVPLGALTVPFETIQGKTMDGESLEGVDRIIYTILSVSKIGSASLYLSPLITPLLGQEFDGMDEAVKGGAGMITGTIWQAVYLGHRYLMNPEGVNEYLDKKPRLKKASMWIAENMQKLNLAKKVISENMDKIDMDKIEQVIQNEHNLTEVNA